MKYFTDLVPQGHINNLYNTTFWALIQKGGMNAKDAEKALAVRFSIRLEKGFITNISGLSRGRQK